jgi:ankyrin repeat protein
MVIVQANSSLRLGIQQNDLSLVQSALRTGADANLIETNGTPVLSTAIQRGATDIALALLGAGADPNRLDRQGKSARDYAEASGNRAIIEAMKR